MPCAVGARSEHRVRRQRDGSRQGTLRRLDDRVRGLVAKGDVAALRLETHPALARTALERQSRTRTILCVTRPRIAEAARDVAAHGLGVYLAIRRTGEVDAQVAAHGRGLELAAAGECERDRYLAGYRLESAAGHGTELELRIATHRRDVDFTGRRAGQRHVAADALDLDDVRSGRRQVHVAADRADADIAADLAI